MHTCSILLLIDFSESSLNDYLSFELLVRLYNLNRNLTLIGYLRISIFSSLITTSSLPFGIHVYSRRASEY